MSIIIISLQNIFLFIKSIHYKIFIYIILYYIIEETLILKITL